MIPKTLPQFGPYPENHGAIEFCSDFIAGKNQQKFVFGRNDYGRSIANCVDIDGFIDDFCTDSDYCGKRIFRTEQVPKNSLIVSSVLGRPWSAKKRLDEQGLRHIDYFSFLKYSGLPIAPVRFWPEFQDDFQKHRPHYDALYRQLADETSRSWLIKILNFRLSYDLDFMAGAIDNQLNQYFENFLGLKPEGEIFVDIGGFDGHTSAQFLARCPGYEAVHIFEPDPKNMEVIKQRFSKTPKMSYYTYGLSNTKETLRFQTGGSIARLSDEGNIEIAVDRLDNLLQGKPFTFLKMDIEGAELSALQGARESIAKNHPILAISVYHQTNDFWQIPEYILSIRNDYRIYLRHYTEGIDETVMFFIPGL